MRVYCFERVRLKENPFSILNIEKGENVFVYLFIYFFVRIVGRSRVEFLLCDVTDGRTRECTAFLCSFEVSLSFLCVSIQYVSVRIIICSACFVQSNPVSEKSTQNEMLSNRNESPLFLHYFFYYYSSSIAYI